MAQIYRQSADAQNRHGITRKLEIGREIADHHASRADSDKALHRAFLIEGYVGLADATAVLLAGVASKKLGQRGVAAVEIGTVVLAVQQLNARDHSASRQQLAQVLVGLRRVLTRSDERIEGLG